MKHTKVNDLKKQINILKNTVVKVGYFENSKRTDHYDRFKKDSNGKRTKQIETVEKPSLPNAYIASIHEFGSPTNNIPPRPTLGPALQNNKDEISRILVNGIKNNNLENAFVQIGEFAKGKVKDEISTLKSPALKESTVRARLRHKKQGKSVSLTVAKPLVHTKQMLQAVDYEVGQK